jgi:hypothetical protein
MTEPPQTELVPDFGPRGFRRKLREVLAEAAKRGIQVLVVLDSDPGANPFHPDPSLLDSEVVGNRSDTPPGSHLLANRTVNVVIVPVRGDGAKPS